MSGAIVSTVISIQMSANSVKYERLVSKLNQLSLTLSLCDNQSNSELNEKIKSYELKALSMKECIQRMKSCAIDLNEEFTQIEEILHNVWPLLHTFESLVKLDQLLTHLATIKTIHKNLETHVVNSKNSKDFETKVVTISEWFTELVNEYKDFDEIHGNEIMRDYLWHIIVHWKPIIINALKHKLSLTFEGIDWPTISAHNITDHKSHSNAETITSFVAYFNALITIDMQCKRLSQTPDSDLLLPIEVMITPLKKRFQYHFMETKSKLNRLEKPEWYLSQTLVWIRQNETFLSQTIDPLLRSHSSQLVPSKLQLISGLIECLTAKLKHDLPSLVFDDKLFTHTVDEVLVFSRELLDIEPNIYQVFPNCNLMNVFSCEPFFTRIITLEKKKSTEFVELIVESKNAWNEMCGHEGIDELRICECGDNFVLMLQSITNRCSLFTDNSLKYSFVRLQLDILDDFRLRLIQLIHTSDQSWPYDQQYFAIINTFNYLIVVLNEWKILPFFVQISETYSPNETVFDPIIGLFQHVLNEFILQMKTSFLSEFRDKLQAYQSTKWFCLKSVDNCLSPNASQLLHFISTNLLSLQKSLSNTLFDTILHEMADQINRSLLEDVILKNSFNEFGAKQMDYDISVGLLSVFRLYITRPQLHFATLNEALKLLNLERGTHLLLKDILVDDRNNTDAKVALKEMHISSISPHLALNIIQKRIYEK